MHVSIPTALILLIASKALAAPEHLDPHNPHDSPNVLKPRDEDKNIARKDFVPDPAGRGGGYQITSQHLGIRQAPRPTAAGRGGGYQVTSSS
ncbi:MAG: hypothetical protein Q9218_007595 [Villophora microphyllina]